MQRSTVRNDMRGNFYLNIFFALSAPLHRILIHIISIQAQIANRIGLIWYSFRFCGVHFPSFKHSAHNLRTYSKWFFCLACVVHTLRRQRSRAKKVNNSNSLRCQRGDGWSASNGSVIDVRKRRDTLACVTSLYYCVVVWLKHFSAEIEEQQENTESQTVRQIHI